MRYGEPQKEDSVSVLLERNVINGEGETMTDIELAEAVGKRIKE